MAVSSKNRHYTQIIADLFMVNGFQVSSRVNPLPASQDLTENLSELEYKSSPLEGGGCFSLSLSSSSVFTFLANVLLSLQTSGDAHAQPSWNREGKRRGGKQR